MKVKYTIEGQYYVLTNLSSSSNPLFIDSQGIENFKSRLIKYLNEICVIYYYQFHNDQYQILIELKDRNAFIEFYRKKKKDPDLVETDIPASTYILSQEMANIQSGYAKWFNFRYKRIGALFGRRFTKIWIRTSMELENWIRLFKLGERNFKVQKFWSYRDRYIKYFKNLKILCLFEKNRTVDINLLQGRFQI